MTMFLNAEVKSKILTIKLSAKVTELSSIVQYFSGLREIDILLMQK